MRCRQCGFELDERDRLRNGAYQCPECGAIHQTASSSKASPSPWRRKRGNSFSGPGDWFTQRRFGLPTWSWLAIALAIVVAVVVLILTLGGKPKAEEPSVPQDVTQSAAPDALNLNTAEPGAEGASLPSGEADSGTVAVSTRSTGVAQNDFVVSFDWAMSYLGYSDSLNLTSTEDVAAGQVQHYTFGDWFELALTIDPEANTIRSATAIAQQTDSANNLPVLASMVSTVYGFDNTINANTCRTKIERMIANNERQYNADNFSATMTSDTSANRYTMDFVGKLDA